MRMLDAKRKHVFYNLSRLINDKYVHVTSIHRNVKIIDIAYITLLNGTAVN